MIVDEQKLDALGELGLLVGPELHWREYTNDGLLNYWVVVT